MVFYKYRFRIPSHIFLRRSLEYLPMGKRSWMNNCTVGSKDVTSGLRPSIRPPGATVNRSTDFIFSNLLECDLAIRLVSSFIEHLCEVSELVMNKFRYLIMYLTYPIKWFPLNRIVTVDNESPGIHLMHLKQTTPQINQSILQHL
jgi:hypothetical protein